jgi:hypothetical protein
LAGALPLWLICALSLGEAQEAPALSPLTQQQMRSFPDIQQAIVAITGYDSRGVELTTTGHQLVVTLFNSKLLDAQSSVRETEASKIVEGVTKVVAPRPEFKTVSSIRIDYVKCQAEDDHSHLEDSIEFRRAADGTFRHHIS